MSDFESSKRKTSEILTIAFVCILVTIAIGRLGALQLIASEDLYVAANNNRLSTVISPHLRGVIYDRDGNVLAGNTARFVLTADERLGDTPVETVQAFLDSIGIATSYSEILYALIAEDQVYIGELAPEQAIRALASPLPNGLQIEQQTFRKYLTSAVPTLSHVIGYMGAQPEGFRPEHPEYYRSFDEVGLLGLEAYYEAELRGIPSRTVYEVDATGSILRTQQRSEGKDGTDLETTLSIELHALIEDNIQELESRFGRHSISVSVLDPSNGEVLALVSWPSFDANSFIGGISNQEYSSLINDPLKPLFHRTVLGNYPSGSTIKTLFGAAALEEGLITDETSFLSTGGLSVGPWFFPDWRPGGHGSTNVYHAIADSVNTFFYIIGGGFGDFVGLGIETLQRYALLFGLTSETGIDLPQERAGLFPSPDWKLRVKGERWYVGDTYNTSIGQGDVLVTPLQISRMTAVFANSGFLITPHLNRNLKPEHERIISHETATIIADAMRRTVTSGSATSLQSVSAPVAGKTGTAQWSEGRENHSWFTGYAPFDSPEIVITTLVEEGGDDALALVLTRMILEDWFDESR